LFFFAAITWSWPLRAAPVPFEPARDFETSDGVKESRDERAIAVLIIFRPGDQHRPAPAQGKNKQAARATSPLALFLRSAIRG
jgi:hypothetical protein